MSHKTADKLVFCHEAMHAQLLVQNAGWSPDVVKWDNDDDSDAEDDWITDENVTPSREMVADLML